MWIDRRKCCFGLKAGTLTSEKHEPRHFKSLSKFFSVQYMFWRSGKEHRRNFFLLWILIRRRPIETLEEAAWQHSELTEQQGEINVDFLQRVHCQLWGHLNSKFRMCFHLKSKADRRIQTTKFLFWNLSWSSLKTLFTFFYQNSDSNCSACIKRSPE